MLKCRNVGIQECRNVGIKECRYVGMQEYCFFFVFLGFLCFFLGFLVFLCFLIFSLFFLVFFGFSWLFLVFLVILDFSQLFLIFLSFSWFSMILGTLYIHALRDFCTPFNCLFLPEVQCPNFVGKDGLTSRILLVSVLLSALVKRCFVSRMQDFFSNGPHVTCHLSHVMCHVSQDKGVELVGGGSVINRAYPSSFDLITQSQ